MKKLRKMICRELKNFGDSLFGMKRRLSIRKQNINCYDDIDPLTESLCNGSMQSSTEMTTKFYTDNQEEQTPETRCHATNSKLPFADPNPHQTVTDIPKLIVKDKKTSAQLSKQQQERSQVQEDCSFTWYDFDGRGKITKKDMSTVMKSLYEIIRHNAKNRSSKFIDQYRLHLILMPTDLSNVQGLDLATSYEQIYQVNSMLTSLTNLSMASSEDDVPDSDNTIKNCSSKRDETKKSFSGRCFEELQEMRARHRKKKRSKSTPTNTFNRTRINDENQLFGNVIVKDKQSLSTSLVSLAGSSSGIRCSEKFKTKKQRTKSGKCRHMKRISKTNKDFTRTKAMSLSLQNISSNLLESEAINPEFQNFPKRKHVKTKNKQRLKKDLGRQHVEEWLSSDMPKEVGELSHQIVHHYHHHHYYKPGDNIVPLRNPLFYESQLGHTSDYHHHHIHVHHHHHHYFY